MAAWLESPDHLVVDLRNVSAADMAPLLDEETVAWRAALDWDFEPSAELVRRFVGMQALNGFALREAFFVSFLGQLGVGADQAFSCGFLYFLLALALSAPGAVIWGAESLGALGRTTRNRNETGAEPRPGKGALE